jgi:hypothetical protein
MLFETRHAPGIANGTIDLTFRRWKRPQAVAGNTYRTAVGRLFVEDVTVIDSATISDAEARRSGYPSAVALRADLRGTPDLAVYRIRFRVVHGPDPREQLAGQAELSPSGFADISLRLNRLDRASARGPWTRDTMRLIQKNPAVRAGDLAPQMGQELADFKLNVRKLKNLGLSVSLGIGYRLSPRGVSFLLAEERDS